MQYQPGLHILAEFTSSRNDLLYSCTAARVFFDNLITENNLHKVGEVYHDFDNGGFTAVVCLTESHLSIHTWPEFGLATFDVFLSNYQHDNSAKARAVFDATVVFFEGVINNCQEVIR